MIRALLDINVMLDVLQEHGIHYNASARVLSLCADSTIEGYVSGMSFGILHYILSRGAGKNKALLALKKIRAMTKVAKVDETVIDLAVDSGFADFEDTTQYYCAVCNGLSHIITRDKKDFAKAKITIATPEEFLAMISTPA